MIKLIILLVLVHVLNIIDYCETMYAISIFGTHVEWNPIARFCIEAGYGSIIKLVVVPILLTLQGIIIRFDKRQIWSVYVMLVAYSFVVIHNLIMLFNSGLF